MEARSPFGRRNKRLTGDEPAPRLPARVVFNQDGYPDLRGDQASVDAAASNKTVPFDWFLHDDAKPPGEPLFDPEDELPPDIPADEPDSQELSPGISVAVAGSDWLSPAPFVESRVRDGVYAGVDVVDEPGSLLDVRLKLSKPASGGYRPSYVVDRATIGALEVGVLSVRGAAHFDFAKVRQDSVGLGQSSDGSYAIGVIADGMGSASGSQVGADTAVNKALTSIRAELDSAGLEGADWLTVCEEIREAVRSRAATVVKGMRSRQGQPSDASEVSDRNFAQILGTTAEFAVVATRESESGYAFARVVVAGDGSGFVRDDVRGWLTLSAGKSAVSDGVRSNAMTPLPMTSPSGFPQLQRGYLTRGQALVLTTDGIGDGMGGPASGYLHAHLARPLAAHELLRVGSFTTFQSDDDRGMFVAWC